MHQFNKKFVAVAISSLVALVTMTRARSYCQRATHRAVPAWNVIVAEQVARFLGHDLAQLHHHAPHVFVCGQSFLPARPCRSFHRRIRQAPCLRLLQTTCVS